MKKLSLKKMAAHSKTASRKMAAASSQQKNAVLGEIARNLKLQQETILQANRKDIAAALEAGLSESLVDRLSLQGHLEGIISDVLAVIALPDPIGELFDSKELSNHLTRIKCRTPIGVLGVIYESRPNVTIDISALTIKSGNTAILRGGSESLHTNQTLIKIIQEALTAIELPAVGIQLVPSTDRRHIKEMLRLYDSIDLIIPRGGSALHNFCRKNSRVPIITGGMGICHLFVDESADFEQSLHVVMNAKIDRPSVCNALDTLLVHHRIASQFIPKVIHSLHSKGVSFRLDPISWDLLQSHIELSCKYAQPEDWDTEWVSLILGIKVVQDLDEAIDHISQHSLGHSDGILTENCVNAELFLKKVDSAAVYVNASTRFTDGGQFGLGSEVAISTQKIHARGPMGLQELTSYKWIIRGNYTVRK